MYRYIVLLTTFFYTCLFSYSQNERWQVYLSYTEPLQIESVGNYLYVVMKGSGTRDSNTGNLVRYDLEDSSVKTYDCLHELSDKEIARISYNNATSQLLIVYVNGNIDLLDADDNICNISALKDKSIPGTSINQISHNDTKTYLSLETGIVEIDTSKGVVLAQYLIGKNVYGIQFLNGKAFVSTNEGLYAVESVADLHNQKSWVKVSELTFTEICAFSNILYGISATRLHYIKQEGQQYDVVPTSYYFKTIKCFDEHMMCFDDGRWIALFQHDNPQKPTIVSQNYTWYDCEYISGKLYVCDKQYGLIPYSLDESLKVFAPLQFAPLFKIDSPSRDRFYHIHYVGDRLLIAGGINTQLATYYPETFMFMEEEGGKPHWVLFDEQTPMEQYPDLSHNNSVDLVQDPLDANHFFGAVYRNGLHEYRVNEDDEVEFVRLYNYQNSPLSTINVDTPRPWNYCTCTALQYDKNGNLWMANQQTDTIVRLMRPNGKWVSLFYPEISNTTNVFQYLFTSNDIIFLVSYEGSNRGFFGFDTAGTLNYQDDDRHLLRSSITNQDGTNVVPSQFYCMAEDRDEQVWCGTNEGLFVITSPQNWFDTNFRFHQIKRNRNDGSGYADYLLAGVDVTWIEVDPANRKWVGTLNNGVYLFSHDGQETLHHFTTENSPLLSNRIHSIAVNKGTGRVMFATDEGLCSFDEKVSEPEDYLSEEKLVIYPNPVRPSTNAIVTIEGLSDSADVKILSASGQVVWHSNSVGGSLRWDCRDMSGRQVSSGVYHVVCKSRDSNRKIVSRIVVLR